MFLWGVLNTMKVSVRLWPFFQSTPYLIRVYSRRHVVNSEMQPDFRHDMCHMTPRSYLAIVLFCLLGVTDALAFHKCVYPDGTVGYTDRPCPGDSQPDWEARKKLKAVSREMEDKWRVVQGRLDEKEQACKGGDKRACDEFHRARDEEIKAMMPTLERALEKQEDILWQSCKAGNNKSCAESSCGSLMAGFGNWERRPAEDFLTCARMRRLFHGTFWAVTDGDAAARILPSALQVDKMRPGIAIDHSLMVACFRERASRSEVKGSTVHIEEVGKVTAGPAGNSIRLSYLSALTRGRTVRPEYASLEEAADVLCPR